MLLSHHKESLGREGCQLTEYTNAMGAAFTDTVTRKIMLGNSSLFLFLFPWQVSKSLGPSYSMRGWQNTSCLPQEEDPTLVQILLLDIHQDPQFGCRQISKCKIYLMFHMQPLNPSLTRSNSFPWKLLEWCPSNHSEPVQLSTPTHWNEKKNQPNKESYGDISQQRGRAVPNIPRRFATPTAFGLQG